MSLRPSGRHLPGFVAGLLCAVVIGGGTAAVAAIPSSTSGAITGCVNKDTAAVRIVDLQAGKRCTRKEKQVKLEPDWATRCYRGEPPQRRRGRGWASGFQGRHRRLRCQWRAGTCWAPKDSRATRDWPDRGRHRSDGSTGASPRPGQRRHWTAGPKGDTGATGSTGPIGPKGGTANAGLVYVTKTLTVPAGNPEIYGEFPIIPCPAGSKVINGTANGTFNGIAITLRGWVDVANNAWGSSAMRTAARPTLT